MLILQRICESRSLKYEFTMGFSIPLGSNAFMVEFVVEFDEFATYFHKISQFL